ncbi:hypothetical protein ABKN59_011756 [Abortiporus biennis]
MFRLAQAASSNSKSQNLVQINWDQRFAELEENLPEVAFPPIPSAQRPTRLPPEIIEHILNSIPRNDKSTLITCTYICRQFANLIWPVLIYEFKDIAKHFIAFLSSTIYINRYMKELHIHSKRFVKGNRGGYRLKLTDLTSILHHLPELHVLVLEELWLDIPWDKSQLFDPNGQIRSQVRNRIPPLPLEFIKEEAENRTADSFIAISKRIPLKKLYLRDVQFVHLLITKTWDSFKFFSLFRHVEDLRVSYTHDFALTVTDWRGESSEVHYDTGMLVNDVGLIKFHMMSKLVLSQPHMLDFWCQDWEWILALKKFIHSCNIPLVSLRVHLMGGLKFYNLRRSPEIPFPVRDPFYILDLSSCSELEKFELHLQVQSFYGRCEDYVFYTQYISEIIRTLYISPHPSNSTSQLTFKMIIDFVDIRIPEIKKYIGFAFHWDSLNAALSIKHRAIRELKFELRSVKRGGRTTDEIEKMDDMEVLHIFRENLPILSRWDYDVFV